MMALRALAKSGFLHPTQKKAAVMVKALEKMTESHSPSLLFMSQAHLWGCWKPLLHFAPDQAKILAKKRAILALAATEASSGSDFFSLTSTANLDKKGNWVVNARKTFITNATVATHFLLFARPAASKHRQDLACFLIPANYRGVKIKKLNPLLGLKEASIGSLEVKNAKLPPQAIVGNVNQGSSIFHLAMAWERSLILSAAPGILAGLRKRLEIEARKKIRNGKPLSENPAFRAQLAAVAESEEKIRAKIAEAAWNLDCGQINYLSAARTKLFASQQFESASRILLQLGGKEAFFLDSPLAENFLDSLASSLYSGPNDLLEKMLKSIP